MTSNTGGEQGVEIESSVKVAFNTILVLERILLNTQFLFLPGTRIVLLCYL